MSRPLPASPNSPRPRVPSSDEPDERAQGLEREAEERHPFLVALGERLRSMRARRGLTRKSLAAAAGVSERHLANLEYGTGNASILVLLQVADALRAPLAELLGDVTTSTPEWLLLRESLAGRDEATLHRVRSAVAEVLGEGAAAGRSQRVALVGLRGAGKSSLGQALADRLGFPFVELSRLIEQLAGAEVGAIQALYGVAGYRRYERRALEQAIAQYPQAVIATPGGIVSDAGTYQQLLARCTTVWLRAIPEDHMNRVIAQGDMRPMAASAEAMKDLKSILAGRAPFYSKADLQLDTSAHSFERTLEALVRMLAERLELPALAMQG